MKKPRKKVRKVLFTTRFGKGQEKLNRYLIPLKCNIFTLRSDNDNLL